MNYINGRKVVVTMDSEDHDTLEAIATIKGFRNAHDLVKDLLGQVYNENAAAALAAKASGGEFNVQRYKYARGKSFKVPTPLIKPLKS